MRIAVVSYDFDPPIGGMGAVAKIVTGEIKKAHPTDSFLTISASPNSDIRIASSRWNKSLGCPLFSLLLSFRLHALLREHSVDVLHVHAGSGGVVLLRRPHIPLLVTAHHTYFQEAKYVFGHRPLKQFLKWLMSFLERRTYRMASRIVAVSRDTRDALVSDYGIETEKITVIENPIAEVPASTAARSPNTVLYVGRLEPRKGTDVLLKAFATTREKSPKLKLRLVGRNMMGNALSIPEGVELLGHLSEEDMLHELATATCLVVPSLLEGFGLIAAQGMMAGTCVIVSDAPGLRSIIDHERTGLVTRVGDATSLAAAIAKVVGDPSFSARLGKAAAVEARNRFNLADRAADLHNEYMRLKP